MEGIYEDAARGHEALEAIAARIRDPGIVLPGLGVLPRPRGARATKYGE